MGSGLYGMTCLCPLYLAQIRGYDSLMIGEAAFISGLAMFLTAPLAGVLSSNPDPRVMMGLGFAASSHLLTGLTADWGFNELLLPQILRGVLLMLCMVPINNLALGTLPPDKLKSASGLFNLTRNLGGAVGLAVINTVLSHRRAFHCGRLAEHVTWSNPEALAQLNAMAANNAAHGLDARTAALSQIQGIVLGQAGVMSFIDVFPLFTFLFPGLAAMTLMMQKPGERKSAPAH
ncbi:MFS transporter [Mangrovicoccus ximenensis]|uniref:MFS transporter n=1 Tax=Mangrovicoccus ximenensis TaxID=1911570 RepID=UPI001F025F7C|nr:MFS transporter [Mangrovicoccus ximenensis]